MTKFAQSTETIAFFRRHGFSFHSRESAVLHAAQTAASAACTTIGFGENSPQAPVCVRTLEVGETYVLSARHTNSALCALVSDGARTINACTMQVHGRFLRFADGKGVSVDVTPGRYYLNLLVRFATQPAAPAPAPEETFPRSVSATAVSNLPAVIGDDLKRIRGIGVLIEKKLQAMGFTRYEHIANWTHADIKRASDVLDFSGRIERENWIEQAQILAAGGLTDFSRRRQHMEIHANSLQRLPGLTVEHENMLHALGVTTLKQIAAWEDFHVARFTRHLNLHAGTIAYMKWVPRAKELLGLQTTN